jgi:glycosyltransferase involved in cell wall biosynthesis
VTGFLVQPSDLSGLIEAIDAMVALGADGRAAMGEAAHKLVSAKYDFDAMVQSYLRVYNDAIQAVGKN